MKDLRPGSTGRTQLRVLFGFDRAQRAIVLVGDDKSGNWAKWYVTNIPIADDRFDEHQAALATGTERKPTGGRAKRAKGRHGQ